jgi:hypothetical protein
MLHCYVCYMRYVDEASCQGRSLTINHPLMQRNNVTNETT